tara:strand:+ start:7537 stop:8151 length:615 start_codon:yes stop_codon:yes gene_type:complete
VIDINLQNVTIKNKENLKRTWQTQSGHVKNYTAAMHHSELGGDPEFLNLWKMHFSEFSGKVLEIGAGTGFLARNILEKNKNIDYTILDIERHFPYIQETLSAFEDVEYVKSSEYEKIFDENWDLLVTTNCLSETPRYYYTDILNNLNTKACFIVDYSGDPNDPHFDKTIWDWVQGFGKHEVSMNLEVAGARKIGGIPVYIGREE